MTDFTDLQDKINSYAFLLGQIQATLASRRGDDEKVETIKECVREFETRERQRRLK